jgi:hypothetical protein
MSQEFHDNCMHTLKINIFTRIQDAESKREENKTIWFSILANFTTSSQSKQATHSLRSK